MNESAPHIEGFKVLDAIKNCFSKAATGSPDDLLTAVDQFRTAAGHLDTSENVIEEIKDGHEKTLLHIACQAGNVAVVEYLMSVAGSLAFHRTANDRAFPHRASAAIADRMARLNIFSILLRANPEGVRGGAIHAAAMEGYDDVIEMVIDYYGENNKDLENVLSEDVPELGRPIQCAVLSSKGQKVLSLLLKHVTPQDIIADSPASSIPPALIMAAASNYGMMMEMLLDGKGLTDSMIEDCTDPEGYTIAHLLAENDNLPMLVRLKKNHDHAYITMIHRRVMNNIPSQLAHSGEVRRHLQKDTNPTQVVTYTKKTPVAAVPDSTKDVDSTADEDPEKLMRDALKTEYQNEINGDVPVDIMEEMTMMKEQANAHVKLQQWHQAIALYQTILKQCPQVQSSRAFRSAIRANMSLCYSKDAEWELSKEHARHAIALKPDWWKGFLRLAIGLAGSGDYGEACQQVYCGMLLVANDENTKKLLKSYLDKYVVEARKEL